MIDIKIIRENPEIVKKALKSRGIDMNLKQIVELDERLRKLTMDIEKISASKNDASQKIASAKGDEKKQIIASMKDLDNEQEKLIVARDGIENELMPFLKNIPNIPREDVPIGNESANEVIKIVGVPTTFDFEPLDHIEIGKKLDIIDIDRAVKVSGARFAYIKGDGALLEFALLNFCIDTLLREGFIPIFPPHIIGKDAMSAMGYLEHGGEEEIYHLKNDETVLIGTSEQAIGPMHMNEVLNLSKAPLRYIGFSPCYRREAGSYGKDTKGILRVHQFDKAEMFSFSEPDKSDDEHEFLLSMQEKLMQGLELPYRVVKLATGDLGKPSARTYDIETWMPSQNIYRETHSTSNTTDFQTRRLNIRCQNADGKNQFAHALNGTALAMGRILIAIIENNQTKNGRVQIPQVLRPYLQNRNEI